MNINIIAFIVVLLAMLPQLSQAQFESYQLVHESTAVKPNNIVRTEQRYQVAADPLNQFTVINVRKGSAQNSLRGPVLLLSPFNVDSRHYELTSTGQYKDSFLGNLASKKFDVWSLSDRINSLPLGTCDTGDVDCSIMQTWNLATRIQDAEFVRSLVKQVWPNTDPVIGGTTGGGIAATATVNAFPQHYQGLFSSGSLFTLDPLVQTHNFPSCQLFQDLLNQGVVFLDGLSGLLPILNAARDFPDEPSPIPAFSGFTNHQVLVFLLSTPGALGANSLTPEYIFAAGDIASDSLFFMNDELFYQDFELFGTFVSVAGFADIACGLAGDTTHVNKLSNFTGPVILFGTGQALGPMVSDVGTLFTSALSIDFITDDSFGEGDRYLNNAREKLLDKPLIKWLKNVLKRNK